MYLKNNSILFWLIAAFGVILFSCICRDVIFPFMMGALLAYIFSPVVNMISKSCPRWISSLLLTLLLVSAVIFLAIFLIPTIEKEVKLLLTYAPGYLYKALDLLSEIISNFTDEPFNIDALKHEIRHYLAANINTIAELLLRVISSGNVIANFFSYLVIIPVTTFYLLKDWNKLSSSFLNCIPLKHRDLILEIWQRMRTCLGKFFKGQSWVVVSLSLYYVTALLVLGLDHAIILGITSGVLSFVPFIGAVFCGFIAIICALIQSFSLLKLIILTAIYLVGQGMESYVLSPRFVGREVGIHPLGILLAFFIGIQWYGILGVLLAVPCTAIITDLLRFGIGKFRQSLYFKV